MNVKTSVGKKYWSLKNMQEVRTNQRFVGKLTPSQFFIFPFINYNDKRRTAE